MSVLIYYQQMPVVIGREPKQRDVAFCRDVAKLSNAARTTGHPEDGTAS